MEWPIDLEHFANTEVVGSVIWRPLFGGMAASSSVSWFTPLAKRSSLSGLGFFGEASATLSA